MSLAVASGGLRIEIDESSGAVVGVFHRRADLALISGPAARVPLRLELGGLGWIDVTSAPTLLPLAGGWRLRWEAGHDTTVQGDILARGDDVLFRVLAMNGGGALVERIEYPILEGVGRLGGRGLDELTHSHASGFLFHDPVDLLTPDPENKRRLERSPYPEGFAGSTMQFLAYQARGRGGFLIGTEDAGRALKWFDVAGDGEHLRVSISHKVPELVAGRDAAPPYPVVIAPLDGPGTWTAAADRYRSWAIHQPWAQPGPRAPWLREQVGICTFGVSARHDRSAWLREVARLAGAPVFHVLGPDWAAGGQDYKGTIPRTPAEWLPAVIHEANLRAIREQAGRWAPFEFDLFSGHDPASDEPVLASRMLHHQAQSDATDPGIMRFPFMCPGTAYWRGWHAQRDARLASEHGADALYYDISVHNLLLQCLAEGHDHAPGSGEPIGALFETMYRQTSAAVSAAAGRYVPLGSEVMTEAFLGLFDYAQHRADAGPYGPFEAMPFRDWLLDGRAERIPLLTYVFGERTPLRLDGWAKLSAEAGELWYWVAARVLLEGGLLEVNGEFSLLEDVEGWSEDASEHYARVTPGNFAIDPEKGRFLGKVAQTRVGPANRHLAHGRLLAPPVVETDEVELDWFAYNVRHDHGPFEPRGSMRVPGIMARAWELDGRVLWLVANVSSREQVARIDGIPVELPARDIRVIQP